MCGIVGVLGNGEVAQRKQYFWQALFVDTMRGAESTGMMFVNKQNEVNSYKNILPGYDFLQMDHTRRIMSQFHDYKIVVGHNRFKTSGEILKSDAHPHTVDHITLVHNGHISNAFQLKGYQYKKEHPTVDTFRLTYAMAKEGTHKTLEEAEGGYALVWWDDKKKALFMTKNHHKPLAFAWSKDKKELYFASEWSLIAYLAERNKIDLEGNPVALKDNTLYKFTVEVGKEIQLDREELPAKKAFSSPNGTNGVISPTKWMERPVIVNHSTGLPHLPAVRKAEQEGTVQVPSRAVVKKEPTSNKQIKKTNKDLSKLRIGVMYNALLWGVPRHWAEYRNEPGHGVAEFTWLNNSEIRLHCHNTTQDEWRASTTDLLVPIRIIGVVTGDKTLLGKLDRVSEHDCWKEVIENIDDKDDTLKFIPYRNGEFITKKVFRELTDQGCAGCTDFLTLAEADEIEWMDSKLPVCKECQKDKFKNVGVA